MSFMSAYPPVAFPPPPPTSNTLSSQRRSALVRSSKKLSKVLGDVPRLLDDDIPSLPQPSSLELTRNLTATSLIPCDTESTWRKRKPTHLPPLLKHSSPSVDAPVDSPSSLTTPVWLSPSACRDSVLSVGPVAPSTATATSSSAQRRTKLERLRRKLGQEVPATALFPTTPHTAVPAPAPHKPKTSKPRAASHARARSVAQLPSQADDARSLTFSISSDESVHAVRFTAARVHSPRPHKTKHVYQTGPLPPVPSIPAHLASGSRSSSRRADDDDEDAGLLRPRQKMPAGSMIGGSDFKAAQRAIREGRVKNGMADPAELINIMSVGPLVF